MTEELIETRKRMSPAEQKIIDKSGLLIIVIRGYAKTVNTTVGGCEALMTLISKQSCAKKDPFSGIGAVMVMAMFLTTWNPKSLSILKNSVCLMLSFEECADVLGIGKQFFNENYTCSQWEANCFPSFFEASQEALVRHFDRLSSQYGDIHVLNTLSDKSYKGVLNSAYEEQLKYFYRTESQLISDIKFYILVFLLHHLELKNWLFRTESIRHSITTFEFNYRLWCLILRQQTKLFYW